jgi:hypothetical protein
VVLVAAAVVFLAWETVEFARHARSPIVVAYHCPDTYSRRSADVTANITGAVSPFVSDLRYRVNGGGWIDLEHRPPRVPEPEFTLELAAADLEPGVNEVELTGKRYGFKKETVVWKFTYDPSPVRLPVVQDWSDPDLDAHDGRWEVFEVDGEKRARPAPGHEDYDRILVVTGAFPGWRRVETDVTYRLYTSNKPFGFGVLPMWGGRPDADGLLPRRGWNFSLLWYYSHYEGVGQEFSYRDSGAAPDWVANYRNLRMRPDTRWHLVVECGPVQDALGDHVYYYQRSKWWPYGDEEPEEWLVLTDRQGATLPPGEFCVALNAHRVRVEFGAVRVLPMVNPFSPGVTEIHRTTDRNQTRSVKGD